MDEQVLEKMIKDIVNNINNGNNASHNGITSADYPLGAKRKDLVKTSSGKSLDEITLEAVMSEKIKPEDLRITAQTLEYQAQIADSIGRKTFARNLRRAAELTKIDDNRILEIYNALRPYRSTKSELLAIADELDKKYNASITASLVREAAEVYEKRDRLRKN